MQLIDFLNYMQGYKVTKIEKIIITIFFILLLPLMFMLDMMIFFIRWINAAYKEFIYGYCQGKEKCLKNLKMK